MLRATRTSLTVLGVALAASACSEPVTPTGPAAPGQVSSSAVKFQETGSSVRWNRRGVALFRARGGSPGRIITYLSVAQYRAVLAAEDAKAGKIRPSPAAAAAGASVVVLKQFYPLDAAALEAELDAQRVATPWPGEKKMDFAAGEAIGRAIGAAVLAFAATDNFGVTNPGSPPVGPGYWTSSGAPTVRGGLGARPFFLTSANELLLPPPPCSDPQIIWRHWRKCVRRPMDGRVHNWRSPRNGFRSQEFCSMSLQAN